MSHKAWRRYGRGSPQRVTAENKAMLTEKERQTVSRGNRPTCQALVGFNMCSMEDIKHSLICPKNSGIFSCSELNMTWSVAAP